MTNDNPVVTVLPRIIGTSISVGIFALALGYLAGHVEISLEKATPLFEGRALREGIAVLCVLASSAWFAFHSFMPLIPSLFSISPASPPRKRLTKTRTGRLAVFWIILAGVSVPLAAVIAASGIMDGRIIVSPALAVAVSLIVPSLIWFVDRFYRANVDELELKSMLEASYWSIALYIAAMPIGWLFWKAGLLETMPTWSIYSAVVITFISVFLWRRFR